jgi:hypothetical protein
VDAAHEHASGARPVITPTNTAVVPRLTPRASSPRLFYSCPKAAESSKLLPLLADLEPINPERRTTAPDVFKTILVFGS